MIYIEQKKDKIDIDLKICYNILKSLEFLFVKITGKLTGRKNSKILLTILTDPLVIC